MKHWRWILLMVALLVGGLVLPIAAYVVGGRIIGPYQGPRGLGSYLGSIYADVGRGQPLALALILGPALCVVGWELRAWVMRRVSGATMAE